MFCVRAGDAGRGPPGGPRPSLVQHDQRALLPLQPAAVRGHSTRLPRQPETHQHDVGGTLLHGGQPHPCTGAGQSAQGWVDETETAADR